MLLVWSLVISCFVILSDMFLRLCFYHNGRDDFLPFLFVIGEKIIIVVELFIIFYQYQFPIVTSS